MERWLSPRVGFGLLAALYLLSFPYHPRLRSPNELCRLWAARAVVDFGALSVNGPLQELGYVGDLSCTRTVQVEGGTRLIPCVGPFSQPPGPVLATHYYSSKAPLLSFAGAPVYWALKRFGPVTELSQVLWSRLFLTVAPTLALLWFLRRFLAAYVSAPVADALAFTYGLGTMAFSYSEAFMSHQLTAVLLFFAFYAAWRTERGEWRWWGYAAAGAFAGAAVMAEYTAALGVVCVAAYTVAARWRKWGALAQAAGLVVVGAAPFLVGLMAYHQAAFGGPLTSGYKFLNDAGYQGWHEGGFLGIKAPDLGALGLSFFSPLRGLFALSPFLLLAAFGLKALKAKDKAQLVFVAVLLAANTYFTSSFTYASWGWTVGPRHLTPMLPFLMLPVGLALESEWLKGNLLGLSVACGLCVSSVLATGVVGFVNYIPDDVSTSLWGLAMPLLSDGFYPVSWLAAFVPNPGSGIVLVLLLVAATAWLGTRLWTQKALPLVMVVVVVAHFGVLRAFTRNDSADQAAQAFMKSVWLAPRGVPVRFSAP